MPVRQARAAARLMPDIGGVHYSEEAFEHMRSLHGLAQSTLDGAANATVVAEAETFHEFHRQFPGLTFRDAEPVKQPDLRAHARTTDPWTSHAAAKSVEAKLRDTQQAVLACFTRFGPLCHEDLRKLYGAHLQDEGWPYQSVSGLRTRTRELVDAGLLKDSGRVTTLGSGRKSIIWEKT